jgi:competence protein ComEA
MKRFIRDYFTFNKRERNGVFILLSIITILIIYLNISDKFIKTEPVDFSKFENEINVFNALIKSTNDSTRGEKYKNNTPAETTIGYVNLNGERFNFNPNNLPEKDWKRLGLNDKQIHMIKNYEAKGGKFRKKEDVKKIYCIKEELYSSLEPFIKIPTSLDDNTTTLVSVSSKLTVSNPKSVISLVEINAADSAQLTKLKGIGAFFAKTIINYRNSLGGFVSKEQLMEVWKFDKEKYDGIEKYITVDASKVKKININTCDAKQLKNPYINWNTANAIVNYRLKHGKYKAVEDIKKTDLVDDEMLHKIARYLIID